MKKKWGLICLAAMLGIFFCACGNTQKQETTKQTEAAGSTMQTDTTSEADKATDETTTETTAKKTTNDSAVCKALHVEGTKLKDSDGNAVQLKGVSTHGLAWFPQYVNEPFFHELKTKWKANVVRLAMYTAESGGYCTDGDKTKLETLIDDGVKYATKEDLYVIIDWHSLSDNNPKEHVEEAKVFFAKMAKKYADNVHVIYEICNEPNGNTTWSDIKDYAKEVIPVIRKYAKDAVIIIGTPTWSQDVDVAAKDPIKGYDNLMYTLHYYAATHKDDLRNKLQTALDQGLPVFVTEYGICDASGNGSLDLEQAKLWKEMLDQNDISYIAWNLSNKNESSAMFDASCNKTSGFTLNDLSDAGKWIYQMLSGHEAETAKGETTTQAPKPDKNGLVVKAKVTNSWESNGKKFYQYAVTITNASGKDLEDWSARLKFDGAFELSDSWNGEYQVKGNQLIIQNKDYNGKIAAGKSTQDVGFIVCADQKLKLKD